MAIRSYRASLLFKLTYIALGIVALLLHSGLLRGQTRADMFVYYTNLSNLFSLAVFLGIAIWMLYRKRAPGGKVAVLKGMATTIILATFMIYHFVLLPSIRQNLELVGDGPGEFGNILSVGNLLVHYILPLMPLVDWLLFDEKGRYKWWAPPVWSLGMAAYAIFVFARAPIAGEIAGTGSRYPYPFLDVDVLGGAAVLRNCAVIFLAFMAMGYLYCGLDRLLAKLARRGEAHA